MLLNLDFYVAKYSKEPVDIAEIVRLSLDETNIEHFLTPLSMRLHNVIEAYILKERDPRYSMVSHNLLLIKQLREFRFAQTNDLTTTELRLALNHELRQELEVQQTALEKKIGPAREKEQKLARIAHLKAKLAGLESQAATITSQKNSLQTELSKLEAK